MWGGGTGGLKDRSIFSTFDQQHTLYMDGDITIGLDQPLLVPWLYLLCPHILISIIFFLSLSCHSIILLSLLVG